MLLLYRTGVLPPGAEIKPIEPELDNASGGSAEVTLNQDKSFNFLGESSGRAARNAACKGLRP